MVVNHKIYFKIFFLNEQKNNIYLFGSAYLYLYINKPTKESNVVYKYTCNVQSCKEINVFYRHNNLDYKRKVSTAERNQETLRADT